MALPDTEAYSGAVPTQTNHTERCEVGPGVKPHGDSGFQSTRSFISVLLAAGIASLGGILFGYDTGIISGALLQLRHLFHLSCVGQQLVVGTLFLGAFLASFFGGIIVDRFGRKTALLVASLLFVIGAATQSLSTNIYMLLCGRLVTGTAVSLSTTAECTYISEISPRQHRGMLVSLNEVGITVGFLLAYTVNYSFISLHNGWQYMFAAAMCPALLQMVGTLFLPQSPHYLVLKDKTEQARKVLRLVHPEEVVEEEIKCMSKALHAEKNHSYADLCSSSLKGRMLIGMGLVFLQQFTGQTNVVYYAPTLLKHLGFCSNTAATLASVGLGGIKVVAAVFALLVLDRVGRRVCLLLGIFLMASSILTLGVFTKTVFSSEGALVVRCSDPTVTPPRAPFLNLTELSLTESPPQVQGELALLYSVREHDFKEEDAGDYAIKRVNETKEAAESPSECAGTAEGTSFQRGVTMAALMMYVFAYGISFGTTTWVILSEIFPMAVRGRAISVATAFNWLTNMAVSATFLTLLNAVGVGETLIMYSLVCLLAFLFVFFCVPETKHKSLEEITKELDHGFIQWRWSCTLFRGRKTCALDVSTPSTQHTP
ncbi:solute carrier family 2, facilitated glucose transporter member 10-like isoform X2 [Ornithodoros turicata]|uniref:solute carrier family 2, facilitated glucose transporter member 10-like isoform X2 n=1 Tax=Ornithodoros turicata TaxID=34597 RepID=UPI003139A0AB